MFYVYVDEAGTSQREPVTVVVGVVIHADRHWRTAQSLLQKTYDRYVPASLRPGFAFHAKDIFSGYRNLDQEWPRQSRLDFIGAVASIPRQIEAAVCLGKVRRSAQYPEDALKKLPLETWHHIQAFHGCISRADKYVRDWGCQDEVATVVAEDVPEKRRFLRATLQVANTDTLAEHRRLTKEERESGIVFQTNVGQISRIIDTIHFVEKTDGPLLPIADACAFTFRRYFADQEHGRELLIALLGSDLVWEDWQGPYSRNTFSFDPNKSYPTLHRPWKSSP